MKRYLSFLLILLILGTCATTDANARRRQTRRHAAQSTALPTNVTTTEAELSGVALDYFRKAQNGDAEAMYFLCRCFNDGNGTKRDFRKAVYWANKASENGCPAGAWFVAASYEAGEGVTKSDTKAQEWYNKAYNQALPLAQNGNAIAQYTMGILYYYGDGPAEEDEAVAANWYKKAAEQGYAEAQDALGNCYYKGEGVYRDYDKAVYWYRKAAEQGESSAQNSLGDCYYYGHGVTQDYTEAVRWFRKAVELGNAEAMGNLGFCYEKGKGIQQDKNEARKWYKKAIELGDDDAKDYLNRMNAEPMINAYIAKLQEMDNRYECDCYFIHDISGDRLPELFIKTGSCELDYELHVFTYSNGRVKNVGSVGAGHTGFSKGDGCLLCGWGHMGSSSYSKMTLRGGKLKITSSTRSAWNDADYVDEHSMSNYDPLEDWDF